MESNKKFFCPLICKKSNNKCFTFFLINYFQFLRVSSVSSIHTYTCSTIRKHNNSLMVIIGNKLHTNRYKIVVQPLRSILLYPPLSRKIQRNNQAKYCVFNNYYTSYIFFLFWLFLHVIIYVINGATT